MTALQKRREVIRLFGKYTKRLERLYDAFVNRLAQLDYGESLLAQDALFHFDNFPELTAELNGIFDDFVLNQVLNIKAAIGDGVALAYMHDNLTLTNYSILTNTAINHARKTAAEAFFRGRMKSPLGLNLSQLVWNYAQQAKSEFEVAMSNVITDGLKKGTSAEELGRKVRHQLNNPDMMYRRYHEKVVVNGTKKDVVTWRRRVIDENGKVRFVKQPLEKVGTGTYRSARMNAYRLTRSEINMAYHRANYERWQQEPFVIGIHIRPSDQHPADDICDELEGFYPKDFLFIGWHPACYSDDTKVLTNKGWKLFADVEKVDLVLSLNPQSRQLEWSEIESKQVYDFDGTMIRFHNRSLDCLVTPEHRMVYLKKTDGRIEYCSAAEYRQGLGAFYRGCEYDSEDISSINIGGILINFDSFCEFMGYWLSDGVIKRDYGVYICQKDGERAKSDIMNCIAKMGFKPLSEPMGIYFTSREVNAYLKQFGRCDTKFIPNEIKESSKRQISIFLDAFAKCDGHVRMPHPFIGNRGKVFMPKNAERTFYTTSVKMCGDICELLLKIGHRPSVTERQPSVSQKADGTMIVGNLVCYNIRDCKATTATVFEKDAVPYYGKVYDITLTKNHIMYIQRDGRCFWGSNCMDTCTPITLKGDERKEFYKRLANGEDMSKYISPNRIKDVPDNYKRYIEQNADKIVSAEERGKLAWHLAENRKYWEGIVKTQLAYKEIQHKLEQFRNIPLKQVKNPLSGSLYMDVTGGIATVMTKEFTTLLNNYYRATSNKEKVAILKQIKSSLPFERLNYHSTKDNSIYGIGMKDFDRKLTEKEMPKNLALAKKALAHGYDVYLLTNPNDIKSADFLFEKKNKIFYVEGKTATGKNSLIHNLNSGATQSERVAVDIVGNKNTRYIFGVIKQAFNQEKTLQEIILFKGGKMVNVARHDILSSKSEKIFRKKWEQ